MKLKEALRTYNDVTDLNIRFFKRNKECWLTKKYKSDNIDNLNLLQRLLVRLNENAEVEVYVDRKFNSEINWVNIFVGYDVKSKLRGRYEDSSEMSHD